MCDGRNICGYFCGWWVLTLFLLHGSECSAVIPTLATIKAQKCTYQRAYAMNGAHCSGLNLHYVPNTLRTNIEILDLSFNRIRDLKNSTFANYPKVRYLYLGDNMIQNIELNAFEPMYFLEVLDLSLNALKTIPPFILNMPMLRKLYMADNALDNLNQDLESIEKPIKAPLQYLNLANCFLKSFPDFGILPDLEHLNVSGNMFRDLGTKNISKMCGLKMLDLTDAYYPKEDICLNKPLAMWFIEKRIVTVPETYSIFNPNSEELKRCPYVAVDEDDEFSYNECKVRIEVKEIEKASKKTWVIIAGSLGAFLMLAVTFLYCMHRRNARQTKKNEMREIGNQRNLLNNSAKGSFESA